MNKTYLKYGLHVAILGGLIVAGFKYLSGEEILAALGSFDYRYTPLLLALSVAYVLVKGWRFIILTQPYTDLPWGVIMRAYVAGQAATLLPGGVAARAGLLNQADVPVSKGSVPVAFSSGMDQVVLISGALIAALWFEQGRTPIFIIIGLIVLLAGLLIVPVTRQFMASTADWIAAKCGVEEKWHGFLKAVPEVFTWPIIGGGLALTALTVILHLTILYFVILGLGETMRLSALVLAYILPTVLGRLSGLPGGVGVTEASMVGFMTSTSDIGSNTAIAAVALFRIVTILFAALLGALVYFVGWRGEEEAAASSS
ncbi:MAG TPA: lysylphosphatidylglycerol synthase transmembrane domain-containing protein [Anaerolineae bacterium]|nr:flippase-like domain-containing protein [Anaerolineae bacterium]MCB0224931.1 flippase-like domain-containing protein [Anaerolineae bacterium]MCB9103869.1 flippase-like domain-containing protein [Anaerolineales bacterium]HRV93553.1 lysylphosphatidylglycerol synthase transmembrane domain-containing protein [Anaerolineae bacterium]